MSSDTETIEEPEISETEEDSNEIKPQPQEVKVPKTKQKKRISYLQE